MESEARGLLLTAMLVLSNCFLTSLFTHSQRYGFTNTFASGLFPHLRRLCGASSEIYYGHVQRR